METADDARRRFLEFRDEMDRTGASEELGYLGVNKPRANLDVMEEVHLGSLRVAERMGRKEDMARNYSYLGAIYLAKRELSKAEEMYGAEKWVWILSPGVHSGGAFRTYDLSDLCVGVCVADNR